MAGKSDFTEQEWEDLRKGATGAGLLVSVSDRGFFDTFKEAGALAKHLTQARQGGQSELVRELGETKSSGFGWRSSPEEVESETLGSIRSAVSILETKAPDDVEPYRAFVLEVAQSVGSAAAGGEAAEAASLEKIRSATGA
jgi:hypothetical protein